MLLVLTHTFRRTHIHTKFFQKANSFNFFISTQKCLVVLPHMVLVARGSLPPSSCHPFPPGHLFPAFPIPLPGHTCPHSPPTWQLPLPSLTGPFLISWPLSVLTPTYAHICKNQKLGSPLTGNVRYLRKGNICLAEPRLPHNMMLCF